MLQLTSLCCSLARVVIRTDIAFNGKMDSPSTVAEGDEKFVAKVLGEFFDVKPASYVEMVRECVAICNLFVIVNCAGES